MTEGGDLDKLGRGAIWEGQIPDCLHQNHIFRIRANRDVLEPEFYALIVESDIAKAYFNRWWTSATARRRGRARKVLR